LLDGDWIIQTNIIYSYPGIIRAWHTHERGQIDYFLVLKGAIVEGIDRLEESLIGENTKLIKTSERNAIKLHVEDYSELIL